MTTMMQSLFFDFPNQPTVEDQSLETVADPVHAMNWFRMCSRSPLLMKKFESLFIASQLTLLAHGVTPELV